MARKALAVEELLAAAKGKSARSPLFVWLHEHYDEIAPVLNLRGPDWEAMAQRFADAGILGGKGKQPDARIVAKTWSAVKRLRKSGQARSQPKAAPLVQPVTPTRSAPIAEPSDEDDDQPMKPVRLKY